MAAVPLASGEVEASEEVEAAEEVEVSDVSITSFSP